MRSIQHFGGGGGRGAAVEELRAGSAGTAGGRSLEPRGATVRLAQARILIIEDYKSVHDLIRAHLSDEPYDFLSAYDAASGLSMAKEAGVDLVLLDLDLPDINGFDVCRELKANPATAGIAVIFLTASNGLDEKEVGMGLEASDYVTKPFDPGELSLRIRSALRVKRLLDLLPASERDDGFSESGDNGRCLTPRLSLPKMLRARRMNPWGRRAPGGDGTPTGRGD